MKNYRTRLLCLGLILGALGATGCTLALKLDELQEGYDAPKDTDDSQPCDNDADCEDLIDCTNDICDSNGLCAYLTDNSLCEPLEICDPEIGCVDSGDECVDDVDCSDGVGCTEDICDQGMCFHVADDNNCLDPENLCFTLATCDVQDDCQGGVWTTCEPSGAICAETACDPATGECSDFLMAGGNDDEDMYLDEWCGGDDCDDDNELSYPGAPEVCDGEDNNCDGFDDITVAVPITTVAEGSDLHAPAITFDGTHYAVAWQSGVGPAAQVWARFADGTGVPLDSATNLTPSAGATSPQIVTGDTAFHTAWISEAVTGSPEVRVIDLAPDGTSGAVVPGTSLALESTGVTSIGDVALAWDEDSSSTGWVVGFSAGIGETPGSDRVVYLQTQDMVSTVLAVETDTGDIGGISVQVLGDQDYVIAYARESATSLGNAEVFASRVENVGGVWANQGGYPQLVSNADGASLDLSVDPLLAGDGAGGWTLAYTERPDGGQVDLVGWNESGPVTLINGFSQDLVSPGWAFDGTLNGALYVRSASSINALEFELFDGELAAIGGAYNGTVIASVLTADGAITDSTLAEIPGSLFAAAWISQTATNHQVNFMSFGACTP